MPIYEYLCEQCGHQEDVLQKISDDPLTVCSECGKSALRKLVSAPNFRLKGSGWYETDFKKDNKRNLADDGGKPEAAKPKKDDAKDTKAKPAAEATKPAAKKAGSGDGSKSA